jgi:hypothetical protein
MLARYWPALALFFVSLTIGLLPIASVIVAGTLANTYGCTLHEGFPNPCIILGKDRGDLLYTMGVAGWFMFFSIPIGLMGVLASLILALILFLVGRSKKRSPPATGA